MSIESSSFLSGRKPGDCRPRVDQFIYFPGDTADKPVVEGGTLVFKGGYANVPGRGIGMVGPGSGAYRIPYDDILPGGAGVKRRCPTTDTKQRLRFTVLTAAQCGGYRSPVVSLELKPIDTCAHAYEYDSEIPLHLFKRCSTLENDCQIVEELARQFNRDYAHLGTAYTVMEGASGSEVYALDIEALEVGQVFRVEAHGGLSAPRLIVAANKRTYTRELIQDWAGTAPGIPLIYGGVDASLNAIEITFYQKVGTAFSGAATSDMSTDTTQYTTIKTVATCVFEDNTNANAALAELILLLKGGAITVSKYLAKLVDETCVDQPFYPFTLIRTDAGDASALDTVKTLYSTGKNVFRAGYIGGKSYYQLYTNSAAVPAPTSAQAGDLVLKGWSALPQPYTVSTCPAGTACADCPPVNPSIIV